jgi:hypothetical protein
LQVVLLLVLSFSLTHAMGFGSSGSGRVILTSEEKNVRTTHAWFVGGWDEQRQRDELRTCVRTGMIVDCRGHQYLLIKVFVCQSMRYQKSKSTSINDRFASKESGASF